MVLGPRDMMRIASLVLGSVSFAGACSPGQPSPLDRGDASSEGVPDAGSEAQNPSGDAAKTGADGVEAGLAEPSEDADVGADGGTDAADILELLRGIPRARVTEVSGDYVDARSFDIEFDQPVDHEDPTGPRFEQRLTLVHRGLDAPMVLALSGYGLASAVDGEVSWFLNANVLFVSHRFFADARPEPPDWTKLTVAQAAGDDHDIVEAFRSVYQGRWISTGGSKGGMTALFHRRFYPDDVDGTLAYGAPLSFGTGDTRYLDFLDRVVDADCRDRLRALQREALLRRVAIAELATNEASATGRSFSLFGMAPSLEATIIEYPFSFWMFNHPKDCVGLPGPSSSDDEVWLAIRTDLFDYYENANYLAVEPYYWQSAVELGAPAVENASFQDLLTIDFSSVDSLPSVPFSPPAFRPEAMLDISRWVMTEGRGLMFIYGELDPWSAGAVDLGGARDSYEFFAPGGNHLSVIANLSAVDRDRALSVLSSWAAVPIAAAPLASGGAPGEAARVVRPRALRPHLFSALP